MEYQWDLAGNNQIFRPLIITRLFIIGVEMARIKFDDSIKYIRVRKVDEIDFDNLPETAKRQLAKAYTRLLGKSLKDANCENSQS